MKIEITTLLGMVANVTSNAAFVPQIFRSYKRKKVNDISISMFFILLMTQLCWIAYAIPIHATQLWVSCALEILLLIPIFVMYFLYRTNDSEFPPHKY